MQVKKRQLELDIEQQAGLKLGKEYDKAIYHCPACLTYMQNEFSSVPSLSCLTPCDLMQHTRPPCPSPTPRVYSNSCPLSRWCHPTISSSVVPFSSLLQSFPAWGSFQISRFITLGGQNIGVSASVSVLPKNIQDWFPLGWTVGSPCRIHLMKCWAAWITNWNQDCQEKYQKPQICGWNHSNGRKRRDAKEPLGERERGEWKKLAWNSTLKKLISWPPVPKVHGK